MSVPPERNALHTLLEAVSDLLHWELTSPNILEARAFVTGMQSVLVTHGFRNVVVVIMNYGSLDTLILARKNTEIKRTMKPILSNILEILRKETAEWWIGTRSTEVKLFLIIHYVVVKLLAKSDSINIYDCQVELESGHLDEPLLKHVIDKWHKRHTTVLQPS